MGVMMLPPLLSEARGEIGRCDRLTIGHRGHRAPV